MKDGTKLQHVCSSCWKTTKVLLYVVVYRILNPFLIYILSFLCLSFVGAVILKALKPRTEFNPGNLDLFFTSVSAATNSSISTVEMEVFSNAQLIVMTMLMLLGGEVFTSMIGLYFARFKTTTKIGSDRDHDGTTFDDSFLKYDSIKFMFLVVLCYFILIQALGVASVMLYLSMFSSAESVLRNKGIKPTTFAFFSIISTFASVGFMPTNENMMVFRKNSGLLLILMPQILLGNTLFPPALRLVIWAVGKRVKKVEANYLLNNSTQVGYLHLLPRLHSLLLIATALGFVVIAVILFCVMEWNLVGLDGMNTYQKVVGIIFQCFNTRYSGESIVGLSTVAPAILVFFTLMMYLPPYTSFHPVVSNNKLQSWPPKDGRKKVTENVVFSQLSYLVICIIAVCITERKKLKEDPLNFSVLNIVFEVISAYGNAGFTTGYSCERQLRADPKCVNKYYGFSAKWSDQGKIIIIMVMLFGRLKKFNMNGGRAWKLL